MISNYEIGTDCEFFLFDTVKNEFITAEGIIQGTKWEPYRFNPENKYFATSLDCVLAEGNIPPVTTKEDWLRNMQILKNYINSQLPKQVKLIAAPAVYMPISQLQSKTAKVFGCDPANNVYTHSECAVPNADTTLRSAGLHVHISYEDASPSISEHLVKLLDLYLSLPAVILEEDSDRKTLYGQAGEFRFGTAYTGVEYRSLSAYWAENDERLGYVYENTERAIAMVNSNFLLPNEEEQKVRQAINTNDKRLAESLINTYQIPVL